MEVKHNGRMYNVNPISKKVWVSYRKFGKIKLHKRDGAREAFVCATEIGERIFWANHDQALYCSGKT